MGPVLGPSHLCRRAAEWKSLDSGASASPGSFFFLTHTHTTTSSIWWSWRTTEVMTSMMTLCQTKSSRSQKTKGLVPSSETRTTSATYSAPTKRRGTLSALTLNVQMPFWKRRKGDGGRKRKSGKQRYVTLSTHCDEGRTVSCS